MKLLLLAMAALAFSDARADVELLATPLSAGAAGDAVAVSRHAAVTHSTPVFDAGERRALRELGDEQLAASVKLTVRSARDAEALRRWAADQRLRVKLEENPVTTVQASGATSLKPLQWGLENRGLPQKLLIDDLTTIGVPGTPGYDVGVSKAPAENPSPEKSVIVAVLDTGVDYDHPDLRDQLARKPGECAALAAYKACLQAGDLPQGASAKDKCADLANVDSDGDGYPLDCSGWNVTAGKARGSNVYGDWNAADDVGHGTHVAGIVGALARDGSGAKGVASNVVILPVKVIKTSPNQPIRPQSADDAELPAVPAPGEKELKWGQGFGDLLARGMLYAVRNGAQVINMSLAWPAAADSVFMRRMVELAQAHGALIVAAAGNDSADARVFPCQYEGVVCVGSHGPDGSLSHFSNFGSFVDVAAPGLAILSTWPRGKRAINFTAYDGYEIKNGTSMAAPFVAGAAARLLNAGYSPAESYARLVVAARPLVAPSYPGAPTQVKYARSGAVDVAASLAAVEQPLFLPADKRVVGLNWNLRDRALPLAVPVRNFWGAATGVTVHAIVRAPVEEHPSARLAQADWSFERWEKGAVKTLETTLELLSPDVDGRLFVELEIASDQGRALSQPPRVIRVPLEISVPVTSKFDAGGAEQLAAPGVTLTRDTELRTVTSLDGLDGTDYVAVTERGALTHVELLAQRGARYELTGAVDAKTDGGDLMVVQRLAIDQLGPTSGEHGSQYVFIFRLPPPQGERSPVFRFLYYDGALKLLRSVDYDNKVAVMNERFQWLRIPRPGVASAMLVPAWISLGKTPELEKPAADPWDPDAKDQPKHRIYYLAPDGLRSIAAPGDAFFIQLLAARASDQPVGVLQAVAAKGDDYNLAYTLVTIDRGRAGESRPLSLERFRMLAQVEQVVETTQLDRGPKATATSFTDHGVRGILRSTVVSQPSLARDATSYDFTQKPSGVTDSVVQLSGLYTGSPRKGAAPLAAFSQSHYELQFDDLATGQTARAALDRFSFLPAFIFARTLFPVAVDAGAGVDRLPGILVPASLGATDAAEIVLPSYAADGRLKGLSRPARFRFSAGGGCQGLGNPVAATPDAPTKLVFFCGDRFIRVPLDLLNEILPQEAGR